MRWLLKDTLFSAEVTGPSLQRVCEVYCAMKLLSGLCASNVDKLQTPFRLLSEFPLALTRAQTLQM